MCGILGYSAASKPSAEFMDSFTRLFELSEDRGRHASGVAWETTNGMGLFKLPIESTRFIQLQRYRGFEAEAPLEVVAHTRWASQGDPANPLNNHPHLGHGLRLALVHNGHITNWVEVAREKGLRIHGECDSEVIARLVERHLQGRQDLLESVRRAARVVSGGATFASLLIGKQTVVYRWLNPLAYAKIGNAVVFASEAGHIREAFEGSETVKVEDGFAITLRRGQLSTYKLLEQKVVQDQRGWYRDPAGRICISSFEEDR